MLQVHGLWPGGRVSDPQYQYSEGFHGVLYANPRISDRDILDFWDDHHTGVCSRLNTITCDKYDVFPGRWIGWKFGDF